jgi:hypothetical protein
MIKREQLRIKQAENTSGAFHEETSFVLALNERLAVRSIGQTISAIQPTIALRRRRLSGAKLARVRSNIAKERGSLHTIELAILGLLPTS